MNCKIVFEYFTKNKKTVLIFVVFILIVNAIQIYGLTYYNSDILASFSQLHLSLRTSIYYWIICALFTHVLLKNKNNQYIPQYEKISIISLILINLFLSLIFLIYNIAAFLSLGMNNNEFVFHILKSVFVNLFLTGMIGIVYSYAVSKLFNNTLSYVFIVLFCVLGSPGFENIVNMIYQKFGVNAYPLYNLFNIYTPSLHWEPNFALGYSILPYRVNLMMFWLFLFVSYLTFKCLFNSKIRIIITSLSLIISILHLLLYFIPSSKFIMDESLNSSFISDRIYYNNYQQYNKSADFEVIEYDMKISVCEKLYVDLTMKVNINLPEYIFTLYHGYSVENVCDQDNTFVDYNQDGDYIIVKNCNNTRTIKMRYSGYSDLFYTNKQGIMLLGFFPYYPLPGYKCVFDNDSNTYNILSINNEARFKLYVDNNLNIYTNIEKVDNNIYVGKTKNLTIISGYFNQINCDDIVVVYPYLNTYEYNEKNINDLLCDVKKKDIKNGKKYYFIPNLNLNIGKIDFYDYSLCDNIYLLMNNTG